MFRQVATVLSFLFLSTLNAQDLSISGNVSDEDGKTSFIVLTLKNDSTQKEVKKRTTAEGEFLFSNLYKGNYTLTADTSFHKPFSKKIKLKEQSITDLEIRLTISSTFLAETLIDQTVISGTMEATSKTDSPVPVEVYTPEFFKKNPTPSIFEALQNVNGVRPQNNCAVCNTGDIHINGLEGAYTMVLIDGMPIVSGLSTVYGLNGIPNSMIERVEIVKGPASTLYGSEAVGGIINVITKTPSKAPVIAADVFTTSWGEVNTDLSFKAKVSKNVTTLIGANYFNYQNRIDNNGDNFTDIATQDRFSIFNKWNFKRKDNKVFTLAGRYLREDRFGGELNWEVENRGKDDIYGESIYTRRWEAFGTYQLPIKEKVLFQFSANGHNQNSVYGDTEYIADQRIAFGQFLWHKKAGENHKLLSGLTMRYTYYDDNTPATASNDSINQTNKPTHTYLPGIFIQDEITLHQRKKLLLGMRYDHNSEHGSIFTPRANYKITSKNEKNIIRFSFGTGYRVVNVFTEDHAAFTGARDVVITEDLNPETSYNGNINYVKKLYSSKRDLYIGLDGTLFYTYFNNKIFPDYDTDPNKIIYSNLDGYGVSQGLSLNLDIVYKNISLLAGGTLMDVSNYENNERIRQELTERFTGTWSLTYNIKQWKTKIDYTGNLYSPMELPTLGETDPRPTLSPWYSIQNIQVTKSIGKHLEIYGGVKNIFNWTPWKSLGNIDMIQRWFDPFDKNVTFDGSDNAVATAENPNAMTFDPGYVYGPNQGIRGFLGLRVKFNNFKKEPVKP